MPQSDRRTFVVLDQDVSVAEGKKLLGRIVTDVRRPLDSYEPLESPMPLISKYLRDPRTETSARIAATAIRQGGARVALFGLLGLGLEAEKERDEFFELHSKTIRTFGVRSHERLFEELMDLHGDAIEALSRHERAKNGLYMLIAFKVAEDAMIVQNNCASVASKVHVDGGVAVASVIGVNAIGNGAFGTVSTTVTQSFKSNAESVFEGERVFAMEYCEIISSITGFLMPGSSRVLRSPRTAASDTGGKLRWERKMKVGQVAYHGKRILAFGSDDEDDDDTGDERQEDENEDLREIIELV